MSSSALDPERFLNALYAEPGNPAAASIDWRRATGLVHVAAIAAPTRRAIAIGPEAPTSVHDRRVLGFARARADAIVTTGAILRAEPGLVHAYAEEPDEAACWAEWRQTVLGRSQPPIVMVLTRGGDLPAGHPVFGGTSPVIVWTTPAGQRRLAPRRLPVRWAIASADGSAAGFLGEATRWLRDQLLAQTIVLESGPLATEGLYAPTSSSEAPTRVDELLLSVYCGGSCPTVPGPALPESEALVESFARGAGAAPALVTRRRVDEPSGRWSFERYRRAAA